MRTSCSKRLWWIFTPFGGYSILNYYEVQTIYQIITIQVLVIVLEVLFRYSHIKSEWVGFKKKKFNVMYRLVQKPCSGMGSTFNSFWLNLFWAKFYTIKTETVIDFNCRLVAAIVFLGYFNADLTFHVYFCKKVSEFVNQNQWSMQSAYVNRVRLWNQK